MISKVTLKKDGLIHLYLMLQQWIVLTFGGDRETKDIWL